MDLSVIYAAFNAEKTLARSLDGLLSQQTNHTFEIIIVDNNSSDTTPEIIRSFQERYPEKIQSAEEKRQGIVFAHEAGLRLASGEFITFLDDDNFTEPDFVEQICNYFNRPKNILCGAVGGNITAVFEDEEPDWFKNYQKHFACGPQAVQEGVLTQPYLFGAGISIRKKLATEIFKTPFFLGGRNGHYFISGDDSEMTMRILLAGYQLHYSPAIRLRHFMRVERMTPAYLKKLIIGNSTALPIVLGYYLKIRRIPFQMNRLTAGLFLPLFFGLNAITFLKKKIAGNALGLADFYQTVGYLYGMCHFSKRYSELNQFLNRNCNTGRKII